MTNDAKYSKITKATRKDGLKMLIADYKAGEERVAPISAGIFGDDVNGLTAADVGLAAW